MNIDDVLSFIGPSEAEASPLGRFFKDASKIALGPASGTSAKLAGKEAMGKTIQSVSKSIGDKRNIVFTDNTAQEATKDYLNSLVRHYETKPYLDKILGAPGDAAEAQVKESIRRRTSAGMQGAGPGKRGMVTNFEKAHERRLTEMGVQPDLKVVGKIKGEDGSTTVITLPKPYADVAERLGLFRPVKEIK